jgi:uncharacterized membrane protein
VTPPFWSWERKALVVCAAASGLATLYVGLFQIDKLHRLACPFFGSGCESVALASFARILGMADGLLAAGYCGVLCALAQPRTRQWAVALLVLAFVWVMLNLLELAEMQKFGAWCFWRVLTALLSVPIAALSFRCAKQVQQQSAASGAAGPPPAAPTGQSA